MKALSLTQPWASAIAEGHKKVETRSWSTNFRGIIAIHASKVMPGYAREFCFEDEYAGILLDSMGVPIHEAHKKMPLGAIVGVAEIYDCVPTSVGLIANLSEQEEAFGNYDPNRLAIFLRNIRRLTIPIQCKGALGLWEIPSDILAQIESQVSS